MSSLYGGSIRGWSYTRNLTFYSLAPSGISITWKVQWKLFSTNIKSYLGAFKTQQIYFFKRSLFACLRAQHFIYSADINWCTGSSKTVYIHSKIHFCDSHTTELESRGKDFVNSAYLQACVSVTYLYHVLGLLATYLGLQSWLADSIEMPLPVSVPKVSGHPNSGSQKARSVCLQHSSH